MDYELDLQTTEIDVNLGENNIELELPGGARGLKGDKGDTGEMGPQGPQGEQGVQGEKGDTGDQGPQGETGPANTLTIGTVEGGDTADATITGDAPNQTLNLVLPKGDKGDTGDTGSQGPQGETGPQGPDGADGADGYSPTVTTNKVGKETTITITDINGPHTATILDGADGQGSGDMLTSVYDTDHNGIVDNAEAVNGHTVGKDVPANAVFTDTTYTNVSEFTNDAGYLTSESDPVFTASDAYGITSTDISNWNAKSDFSGSYNDLTDTPTLATVATSGAYSDLSGTPTIPTVNDATLTIQKNGTDVQTFTANASSDVTANITVPTATSDLTNDSGYTTNTGTITSVKMNGSTVASSGEADLGTVLTSHQSIKTINSNTITGTGNVSVGTITKVQANGTDVASSGTANIPAATTGAYGVTKLSSSTSSTSTALAATASAVKSAYDLATVTISKNNSTTPTKVSFKFPSGLLINTVKITLSSINCNTSWGGIYASGTQSGVSYQTAFTTLLSCTVTLDPTSNNAFLMEVSPSTTFNKLTTSPQVQILRGSSGTVSGVVNVIAIGLWK